MRTNKNSRILEDIQIANERISLGYGSITIAELKASILDKGFKTRCRLRDTIGYPLLNPLIIL